MGEGLIILYDASVLANGFANIPLGGVYLAGRHQLPGHLYHVSDFDVESRFHRTCNTPALVTPSLALSRVDFSDSGVSFSCALEVKSLRLCGAYQQVAFA